MLIFIPAKRAVSKQIIIGGIPLRNRTYPAKVDHRAPEELDTSALRDKQMLSRRPAFPRKTSKPEEKSGR
jgi:hypothetical protein